MIQPTKTQLAARAPMGGSLPEGWGCKVAGWGLDRLEIDGETLKRRGTDEDAMFPYIVLVPASATVSAKAEPMNDADVQALADASVMLLNALVKRVVTFDGVRSSITERKGRFVSSYYTALKSGVSVGEAMPALMKLINGTEFRAHNEPCIKKDEKGREYLSSYVELL